MSTRKAVSTRSAMYRDLCARPQQEPLIRPADVIPSDPRLQVVGVLNPAFVSLDDRRYLVVRVDERPLISASNHKGASKDPSSTLVARVNIVSSELEFYDVATPESYSPEKEPILPEKVRLAEVGSRRPDLLLSFISHLRVVELDGPQPLVRSAPDVFPTDEFSEYGCEDPRATVLDGHGLVTYTAISRHGATAWLCRLKDGRIDGKRILLGPDHKHASLFTERVGGYYYMVARPLSRTYLRSSGIWLFRSTDLAHWGAPAPLLLPRDGMWDSQRIGPCASPVLTPAGWVLFYYGVDEEDSYQVGAVLLDPLHPNRVIGRSTVPVLAPILEWERIGRRADTVFVCGVENLLEAGLIRLYYGAADTCIGLAELKTSTLLDSLRERM